MRSLNICFLQLVLCFPAFSGAELNIVTSGNFKGLANLEGEILIPAVYEGIGWSDGTVTLEKDLIGYLEKDKWGLLNTKNKKVTEPLFHALLPLGENHFIASVQAKLTNHLLHGVIDGKGGVLIPFKYFSINHLSHGKIKVSSYEDGEVLYGVRNLEDEEIVPLVYESITFLDDLIICKGEDDLVKIFNQQGIAVYHGWLDNVTRHSKGFEISEEGQMGLISKDLKVVVMPGSKQLKEDGEILNFKKWEIRSLSGDSIFYKSCDSITVLNDQLWIAHVNDAQHMLGAHEKLFSNQKYLLKFIQRGFIVAQNKYSGKWGLYKTNGQVVEEAYDFIRIDSNYFYCQRDGKWDIYNGFSRKINTKTFEAVETSVDRMIPVKLDGYWGWIDMLGEQIVSFKYDELKPGIGEQYIAKYVGKWGLANMPENWLVLPEYDSIIVTKNLYLAKKGLSTHVYDTDGNLIYRTGKEVLLEDELIILKEEDELGFITENGSVIYPDYQQVEKIGEFYVCTKDSVLEMINPYGRKVLSGEDEVQEVISYAEGFFHIIKNDKHGFVDEEGRLRIANRYDGALPYHDGLAAIKLRGRWGYIDKWERLIIQPHYDTCSFFEEGLANVAIDGKYGIMDMNGEMIISSNFINIYRTSYGNYLMTDQLGKQGLANEKGKILLRPNYDEVIDTAHDFVIARVGEAYGVVTYEGYSYLPFDYKQVEVQGDYLLLVKE